MKRIHTCAECGAILTDPDEIIGRLCSACIRRWFTDEMEKLAAAVIGVPSRALRDERGGEAA